MCADATLVYLSFSLLLVCVLCMYSFSFLKKCIIRRALDYKEVLEQLNAKGISIRVASPKLVMEEAPESYKDVTSVVDTCKFKIIIHLYLHFFF